MTPKLRLVTTFLWALIVVAMVVLLASWTTSRLRGARTDNAPFTLIKSEDAPLPDFRVPAFSLTDQDAQPFTPDRLKGKVWVADFFFVQCAGPCPLMTQKMSALENRLTDPRIHFVSFSIDPENDTPAALKEYADKYDTSDRWHFLTGGDNATYAVARELKLPAVPAEGDNPIFHTTKFVLVDADGKVAGYYDYDDPTSLEKLAADAQTLATKLPRPQ